MGGLESVVAGCCCFFAWSVIVQSHLEISFEPFPPISN